MLEKVPTTPEEALEFITPHFISTRKETGAEFQDIVIELSLHDLLSAFADWDEWNSVSDMMQNYEELCHKEFDLDVIRYVVADGDEMETKKKIYEWARLNRPRKLIKGVCQNCGEHPCTDGNFCDYCGQKIDWSEE